MRSHLIFPALLLAAITLAAQSTSEVAITAEPHHHLLLENEQVRVWLAEVAPNDATLLHRHVHDYVFVSLGETNVQNEVAGKPPAILKMQDGETRFSPGGFAHIARDLVSTPFRAIAVEIMQDEAAHKTPPPAWDEDRALHVFTGGTQHIMFVQDGVRVSEQELQPGATIPSHHHTGPHLVVAVTDLNFRSDVEGQATPRSIQIKSGEVKWVPGGYTHTVTNTGKQEAKFVTLEFH
jgi:quercetin dioxygenase-like cupin family protein